MANLTLSIDDKLLQAARIRAVKEGTSVNEICRQAMEAYARPRNDRLTRYRSVQTQVDAMPRPALRGAPVKSRDDLYQQMLGERSPAPTSRTPSPSRARRAR